ncbi:hypothetical protein DXF91_24175 [Enterobacter roggenkampii]|uniref:Coil containing protein n=1 Tax=Enterobacter roggenkampii TaxID=1812935 RepID=A0ABD7GVW3_9ENTR|nr:hypothetical protein [Enterobacter roggenkampii]RDT11214.1 hypothetical protein DXF88_24560 [Enterobacter roggenkampii]RDT17269.1 hypothetical protein DXF91_24175 [Enterobacter roggenkampii]RDT59602.1 hypothetical protein DXF87_12555 [Enterobacter roggenkampii]
MSNIDKQALIAKIKKQTESFDTVVLKEDEANALLDELEAAENRIADQRETLLAARSYVMQCARMGDAHANGVLQAIDRAAGKGETS